MSEFGECVNQTLTPQSGACVCPPSPAPPGGLPRACRASTAPEGHLCLKPSVGRGGLFLPQKPPLLAKTKALLGQGTRYSHMWYQVLPAADLWLWPCERKVGRGFVFLHYNSNYTSSQRRPHSGARLGCRGCLLVSNAVLA